MPYINKQDRGWLDDNGSPEGAGELNYMISQLCGRYIVERGKSYSVINDVIGALECAKLELYRCIAAPYEDAKRDQNGDISTYKELSKNG